MFMDERCFGASYSQSESEIHLRHHLSDGREIVFASIPSANDCATTQSSSAALSIRENPSINKGDDRMI
jgi:hypothetical protein